MAEDNKEAQVTSPAAASGAAADNSPAAASAISEHTGQFDVRFILWRMFCSETSIPVDTLPSELKGELRERWEKMKDNQLHKPTEETPTPPATNR